MLTHFYAVTASESGGSLYKVSRKFGAGTVSVEVEKLALRGQSGVPVGGKFGGKLLAVCKWLVAYTPEAPIKKIDEVDPNCWDRFTNLIIALFLDENKARECFKEEEKSIHCDPGWDKETREVIDAIGYNHPQFCVGRRPDLRLLP
jgi:hypothetical protein